MQKGIQDGASSLMEQGVTAGSMRTLGNAKALHQSIVPRMLEAKKIADHERLAHSDAIVKGNLLD